MSSELYPVQSQGAIRAYFGATKTFPGCCAMRETELSGSFKIENFLLPISPTRKSLRFRMVISRFVFCAVHRLKSSWKYFLRESLSMIASVHLSAPKANFVTSGKFKGKSGVSTHPCVIFIVFMPSCLAEKAIWALSASVKFVLIQISIGVHCIGR